MRSSSTVYPTPKGGASLILSFRLHNRTTLILGSGTLAATRAFSALEADSDVIVLANGGHSAACPELQWRADHGELTIVDIDHLSSSSHLEENEREARAFQQFLDNQRISLVCVTDTLLSVDPTQYHHHRYRKRSHESAQHIYRICNARNIPVNVTDMPDLCDFSFTSTHRFENVESGHRTPLQIGVTTNGQGCRLAGRIRREIIARLPPESGAAVETVGRLRELAKKTAYTHSIKDDIITGEHHRHLPEGELNEDDSLNTHVNHPVVSVRNGSETAFESGTRRMKWVAQVSEYWPLPKLAKMSAEEMEEVLSDKAILSTTTWNPGSPLQGAPQKSMHTLSLSPPRTAGQILLVGSGPGHPSLLTRATHTALTERAHFVLSDKLVPSAVLALIPPHVDVRIARKFPGNADGAQNELMEAAVEAARRGLTVVRLKQGDPVVYGRAGEEVLYFRSHGFEPIIVPGISSALAAPISAGIPVTQRGVAESFIVCTGVGREGKEVRLPGYQRGRTVVVLMGVARLKQVISALMVACDDDDDDEESKMREGKAYPAYLPIALIERATMPDQRVISSTLRDIVAALESAGEQRPPGLLVIGWAVLAWCWGDGRDTIGVLEDGAEGLDEERVKRWLGGENALGWRVKEGLGYGWADL